MDQYLPSFEDGLEPMQLISEQYTQGTIESLQAELLRYKIALQTTQEIHQNTIRMGMGSTLRQPSQSTSCESPAAASVNLLLNSDQGLPAPLRPEDYSHVQFWRREQYDRWIKANKGDTNGLATEKPKRGRPRKAANEEEEKAYHPYLEVVSGMPVNSNYMYRLSVKARRIWATLLQYGLAPETYSEMDEISREYYIREMCREFFELRLCSDFWKLDLWSQKNYASWAVTHINSKKEKKEAKKKRKALHSGAGDEDTTPASVSNSITPRLTTPTSTGPLSTSPASTASPCSTAPTSNAPASMASSLTALASTDPASVGPTSTAPCSTIPHSASPALTALHSTAPASTAQPSTDPASSAPCSMTPALTGPISMAPQQPHSTVPRSASPASTTPHSIGLPSTAPAIPPSMSPASSAPPSTVPALSALPSAAPTALTGPGSSATGHDGANTSLPEDGIQGSLPPTFDDPCNNDDFINRMAERAAASALAALAATRIVTPSSETSGNDSIENEDNGNESQNQTDTRKRKNDKDTSGRSKKRSTARAIVGSGKTAKNFCMAEWLKTNPDGLKDDFDNYFKNFTEEQLQPFEEAAKEAINMAAREKRKAKKVKA